MKVPRSISVLPSGTPLRGPQFAPPADTGIGESLKRVASATLALGSMVRQQEAEKTRFSTLRAFNQFEQTQRLSFEEAKRNNAPGSTDFYHQVQTNYKTAEAAFLATVPEDLRDEFSVRTADLGAGLGLDAMQYQYSANDEYFRQGIQDAFDQARVEVGQDGSKPNLEKQRAQVDAAIAASGLSDAEKVAITRKAHAGLEGVAYKQAQVQRLRDEQSGAKNDVESATELLKSYGAVPADVAQRQAEQGEQIAAAAIGLDRWATIPQRLRAVLVATAAKTGSLSNDIVRSVVEGDVNELETAVRSHGGDQLGDLVNNPEAQIDNDPSFSNLPYEDRVSLLADAKREVAAETAAATSAAKAANAAAINSLFNALADGTAGQTDIDALREQGVLSDYDDRKKAQDILAKRDEQIRLRRVGQQMLTGEVTFAPGNADHKKILNALVGQDGLTAIDHRDSNYAANTLIPLIRKAGAVPDDVQNLVSGMIHSNDPTKALWALDLMTQMERAAPKAMTQFPEPDLRLMDFWQARKDYLSEDDMMKAVRGPSDPAERNARVGMRELGNKLFTAADGVMRNFDPVTLFTQGPSFLGIPLFAGQGTPLPPATRWVQEQLNSDFRTLFLDNYEVSGDVEAAKAAAAKQLQRVWGVTNVGQDQRLMKYPPEKAYPTVQGNYDWMERQLRSESMPFATLEDFQNQVLSDAPREPILKPNETFTLISDTQTEAEWGKTTPSYLLATTDDKGQVRVKSGPDGLPLRVFFDWTPEIAADEQRWREAQKDNLVTEEQFRQWAGMLEHEQETGVRVPDEFNNLYLPSPQDIENAGS